MSIPKKPFMIALSGMKGSGKDYCLTLMQEMHKCTSYSFSDQLKILAQEMFPNIPLLLDCPPENKEKPFYYNSVTDQWFSHRDIWTKLNVLVEIDPDILVRKVKKEWMHDAGVFDDVTLDFMVVKDLRPHNPLELAFCKENGFKIIYIENGCNPIQDVSKLHVTEQGYDVIERWSDAKFINRKNNDEDFINFLKGQVKVWKCQK